MKGIIMAAGRGSRLDPLTITCNKQLMPVYNKPLIYYPLSTLMLGGIKEILLIVAPQDRRLFQQLLGDGAQWGISLTYAEQVKPRGIAEAFVIARHFIDNDPVCLILGDNIFYDRELGRLVEYATALQQGAKVFGCYVKDPRQYGVVEFNAAGKVVSLEEKPAYSKSSYAVPGLYFYDSQVVDLAARLEPSARGELEITDLNRLYLSRDQLQVELLKKETVWIDAGTPDLLLQAANFVYTMEVEHGLMLGSPEQAAYLKGFVTWEQLQRLAKQMEKTAYGQQLLKLE